MERFGMCWFYVFSSLVVAGCQSRTPAEPASSQSTKAASPTVAASSSDLSEQNSPELNVSSDDERGEEAASAMSASAESPYTNGLEMKFVPVPVNTQQDGRHILFSIYETRVKDFSEYAEKAPDVNASWKEPAMGSNRQLPTHPVVNVDWENAVKFCDWLTEKERTAGRIGPDDRYRLPTDHEWSCSVGIGDLEDPRLAPDKKDYRVLAIFPWGTIWPPPPGSGNFCSEKDTRQLFPGKNLETGLKGYDDGFASVAPVGSFQPNSLGLYDLEGNVCELCATQWTDGPTRSVAASKSKTARGGSFLMGVEVDLLASRRWPIMGRYGLHYCGFRCVLDLGNEGSENESDDRRSPP